MIIKIFRGYAISRKSVFRIILYLYRQQHSDNILLSGNKFTIITILKKMRQPIKIGCRFIGSIINIKNRASESIYHLII